MNRSELKPGRVVECRNGYRYFILINGNGELLGVREEGCIDLQDYDENANCSTDHNFDIIAIYKVPDIHRLNDIKCILHSCSLKCVATVNCEVTMQEIADKFNIPVNSLKIIKE